MDLDLTNKSTLIACGSIVVTTLALVLLSTNFNKKQGKNPFNEDTRRESEEYVYDKAKRDAVIKSGYTSNIVKNLIKNNNNQDFDVIVIGGLMSAALLARSGKKVLVLEQHDQAGGCCHAFIEKGYEFDTGIHYIGEMRNNTSVKFLFDQVSNGQLNWCKVRDDFDQVVLVHDSTESKSVSPVAACEEAIHTKIPISATHIDFKSDLESTIQSLLIAFPNEEVTIRKYFDILGATRKSLLGYVSLKLMPQWFGNLLVHTGLVYYYTDFFKYATQTVTQVLDNLTNNNTLKAVLAYNFGDYGTIPSIAPFSMHAALQNHFLKGVSYPVGGSSEIAFHIIPTITKAGGKVLVRANVESIVTNENGTEAIGVKMCKDGQIIHAPIIISDAGLYNTYEKLLIHPTSKGLLAPMMGHVRHGEGGMSVYVGLKGTTEELGLNGKHYWCIWADKDEYNLNKVVKTYYTHTREEMLAQKEKNVLPMLFISFPSVKDPLYAKKHPGKSTCTIVTFANFSWFKQWENDRVSHRGSEYEHCKSALGDMVWKQTLGLFPHLADKVEYFDIGSPITNKYYLQASGGEMYGIDHNITRFSPKASVTIRPETGIKNLYLAGQDVFTGGFVGASFGGLLAASSILNRNLYDDMSTLKKKSKPPVFYD